MAQILDDMDKVGSDAGWLVVFDLRMKNHVWFWAFQRGYKSFKIN